jgi:exportin-2 (importin alpha re-exporter)
MPIRQSASIYFKNFIMNHWEPDEATGNILSDEDRNIIKQFIIGLMLSLPKLLQAQLHHALALIAKTDFPAKWATLLPELIGYMNADNTLQIQGVLETCNYMFHRYRSEGKTQRLWEEIKYVCDTFHGPFRALFQRTLGKIQSGQTNIVDVFTTLELVY